MEKDLQLLERAARAVEAAQRQRLESVESKKRKGLPATKLRAAQPTADRPVLLMTVESLEQGSNLLGKGRSDLVVCESAAGLIPFNCGISANAEAWTLCSCLQPILSAFSTEPKCCNSTKTGTSSKSKLKSHGTTHRRNISSRITTASRAWTNAKLPVGGGPCISLVLREDQKLRQHAALLQQHCCRKLQQGMQRKRGEASEATKDKELLRRCAMGPLLKAAAGNVGDPRAAAAPAAETGAARDMQPEATDATGETGFRLLLPVTAAHAGVILAPSPDTTTSTNAKATEAEEGGQTTAGGSTGSQSDALLQAYLLPWDETLAECLKGTTIIEQMRALKIARLMIVLWPPPCKGGPLSRLFSGTAQPPPPPPGPPPQHLCPPQQPEQQLLADGELEGSIRCMNGPCVSDHQQQQVQKRPPQVHQNHRPRPPQGCMGQQPQNWQQSQRHQQALHNRGAYSGQHQQAHQFVRPMHTQHQLQQRPHLQQYQQQASPSPQQVGQQHQPPVPPPPETLQQCTQQLPSHTGDRICTKRQQQGSRGGRMKRRGCLHGS
ncbi:zinc finger domain-containing protein [Cyclospora cayetanensis]|uniref:Zinc finger domain-containing protein n=1 Tax=Cyclospora cayetanensis TaxID=88456 RepID=A0A1D3CYD2_9EIME|nr:zinc finger domain-containing protein [Cyclospora cayetanensis]